MLAWNDTTGDTIGNIFSKADITNDDRLLLKMIKMILFENQFLFCRSYKNVITPEGFINSVDFFLLDENIVTSQ